MTKYNKDVHNCKCDNCGTGMKRKPYEIRSGKGLYCSRFCNNESKSKKAYNNMCERVGYDFKQWLDIKYNVEKMNSRDIAELAYGKRTNGPNITNWMKRLDVDVRSGSEAVELQWVDNEDRRAKQSLITKEIWGAGTKSRNKLISIMQSEEYRKKQSVSKVGKKNGMWNPNLTDAERNDYKEKGRSMEGYSFFRTRVYERDSYTCQKCKDDKGGNLVVHHIESYKEHPDKRVDENNGATLCVPCHKKYHSKYGIKGANKKDFYEYLNLALVK